MAGLITSTDNGTTDPTYSALGADGSGSLDSHLDSFFQSSGWTRDDVLLLVSVIELALLAYLALNDG